MKKKIKNQRGEVVREAKRETTDGINDFREVACDLHNGGLRKFDGESRIGIIRGCWPKNLRKVNLKNSRKGKKQEA